LLRATKQNLLRTVRLRAISKSNWLILASSMAHLHASAVSKSRNGLMENHAALRRKNPEDDMDE
jgi:hypothetical protein